MWLVLPLIVVMWFAWDRKPETDEEIEIDWDDPICDGTDPDADCDTCWLSEHCSNRKAKQ